MKDGMKVISLSGYFLLPEGFDGDVSSALRAIADYHDKARKGETGVPRENKPTGIKISLEMWPQFCDEVSKGKKLYMAISLVAWNVASQEWEYTNSFQEEIKQVGVSE